MPLRASIWLALALALTLGSAGLSAEPSWWARLRSVAGSAMGQAKGGRAQVGKDLELRVLSSGLVQTDQGRWVQQLTVQFLNLDSRRYHRQVQVLFGAENGSVAYRAKTFLSLAPGHSLTRRYRAPSRKGCLEPVACPALSLTVLAGKESSAPLTLGREALPSEPSPEQDRQTYAQQVVDGDTLVLVDGERLRLLGIDTPELSGRDGKPQPWAREASEFTQTAVMGVALRITLGGDVRDAYGRLLGVVTLPDGSALNLRLLEEGLARVYARAKHPDKKAYREAEARARAAGKGLWSAKKIN